MGWIALGLVICGLCIGSGLEFLGKAIMLSAGRYDEYLERKAKEEAEEKKNAII